MHICGFERNVYKNYILGGLFTFTKSVESGKGDGVVMAQRLLNRRLKCWRLSISEYSDRQDINEILLKVVLNTIS
jgi:hypothetical protein